MSTTTEDAWASRELLVLRALLDRFALRAMCLQVLSVPPDLPCNQVGQSEPAGAGVRSAPPTLAVHQEA
jgi:hypothetical protein